MKTKTFIVYNDQGEITNILTFTGQVDEAGLRVLHHNLIDITNHPQKDEIIQTPVKFVIDAQTRNLAEK